MPLEKNKKKNKIKGPTYSRPWIRLLAQEILEHIGANITTYRDGDFDINVTREELGGFIADWFKANGKESVTLT